MPKARSSKLPPGKIKIMLDSGAFSAWTRGEKLDLGEYISFIRRYENELDTYINLDVIPGKRGVRPTTREVDYAAEASLENYQEMVRAGLRPIPVFHYGENRKWLEKLLEAGAEYICLGGTVGVKTPTKRRFLDECFTVLTNTRGEPLVKVHGLGVTEAQFVARYPWHSVDSTSWMIAPIYGNVLVPAPTMGSFSTQIWIGSGVLTTGDRNKRFENLPLSAQKYVLDFAAQCGCTITDLRNDVYSRMVVFVSTLLLMQKHVGRRFERRRAGFSFPRSGPVTRRADVDFRIIFAGNVVSNQFLRAVIRRCGVEHHLRSYYEHLKDHDSFAEYLDVLNNTAPYDVNARVVPRVDWKSLNYHDHRRRLLVARTLEEPEGEQEAFVGYAE